MNASQADTLHPSQPTPRTPIWACGERVFDLKTPVIMGILNVTPDSFSDGGSFLDPDHAIKRSRELIAQGADIVDVGGESTRPGSVALSTADEIARVVFVVKTLAAEGVAVSIDTRNPAVAAAALEAGAVIVNDVSGFRDPEMVEVVASARSKPGVILMHMLGNPQTMQSDPRYDDVVGEVATYLSAQASHLERCGVEQKRIALDPGFGFGKTSADNLEILRRTETFAELGYPLVVAVSRKKTIGEITGEETPRNRVIGSVAAAIYAVERGARIVRVHDVRETKQALLLLSELNDETH